MHFQIAYYVLLLVGFISRCANAQDFGWVAGEAESVAAFDQQMYNECSDVLRTCVPLTSGKR
jgi:hypothetical protein